MELRRATDKSSYFPISLFFLYAIQPKDLFWDRLKKLEQRSQKYVELRGEYVE
jgi:hypothetical protein